MITGQGAMETTPAGALRESNKHRGRFDLIPYEAMEAWAIWSEEGAEKYGPRNWEKGLLVSDCINRLVRHAIKAANGWTDEDHLAACMWNAGAAKTMMKRRPDLNDHCWHDETMIIKDSAGVMEYSEKDAEMTKTLMECVNLSDEIYNNEDSVQKMIKEELDKFKPLYYDGYKGKPIAKMITEDEIIERWHLDPEAVKELKKRLEACGIKDADEIHEYPNKPICFDGPLEAGVKEPMTLEQFVSEILGVKYNLSPELISKIQEELERGRQELSCISTLDRDSQVHIAEAQTLDKILKMFKDVTNLDIRDREYLGRCIGDGRVQSLDSIEQFLNKIQGG